MSGRARGRGSFGLANRGGRGRGSFRARGNTSFRGRGGRFRNGNGDGPTPLAERFETVKLADEIDEKLGFGLVQEGIKKEGWLVNMHPTTIQDPDWPSGKSAVDFYFIQDDGGMFKCTYHYEPYFYIACKIGYETTIEEWLVKHFEGLIVRVTRQKKEDLNLPNHLLGHRRLYFQISFRNVHDLLAVRGQLLPIALANSAKRNAVDAYAEVVSAAAVGGATLDISLDESFVESGSRGGGRRDSDPREGIIDIREFDIPYYLRVAIDNDMRVGLWYAITFTAGQPTFDRIPHRVKQTTKAPLKFPDQNVDQVMMISYMVDGQGYLITNREIVSEDIEDFEYTPKEGYEGPFIIFNERNEEQTIRRFFSHIREVKPTVIATFNGDFFDFPFLEARASANNISMYLETGFMKDSEDEYKSRGCAHMDCFRWVKRDSYLPQGSQGLKAVTTAKLGYNPIELDPELMTPYASEQPQILSQYSVSDAVATYYLYMKYVHPFIFSLCNIIPLCPDEVLRKGSGTLCETLLMVEAYRARVIMPNRHEEEHGNMYDGHLLASETYVGGRVEALEAGVFRSDIPAQFRIEPEACDELISQLDDALQFCIKTEFLTPLDDVTNYDEVKAEITAALELMRDNPKRMDPPLIYHLDVAAMYPNIMLSNRLQPDSMVDEADCAVCDFNRPGKTCDRRLEWAWRGEFFPAHRDEFNMIKHALNQENFPSRKPGGPERRFHELSSAEQTAMLHKRLGDYSRKVYKKTKDTKVETRESIVCQRENPFYVDTVRTFRDRRYEYKGLHKTWKKNLDTVLAENKSLAEVDEAKKMVVLYDSLQLAHKCILNSFYGYVMRKGARWHSMEMAGITCYTGATIIQLARQLVERIGRPLELDTDGIWCMLPGIFPENFKFKLKNGKTLFVSYPCTMLNHLVHAQFTNDQYHDLDPKTGQYAVHSENSIFFELDGPYKAMILPSSKEEDKLLKKRYAVFNDDGSLAELKGFEVKRRGELQLIKIFQSQLFERFLLGTTTEECYASVAKVADQWLDVLFSRAEDLSDEELVELIAENRSMSKTLAEYGGQKSTSISTARRLAEFLGDGMIKDKGLACKFIISAKPLGAPVTERAVPVAIFSADESVKRTYLRKWLKDNSLLTFDLRDILDWDYYIERLGGVIQKLITIPAAMQKVPNPVPRIKHPDWLHRRVAAAVDRFKQNKVTDFFKPKEKDIDDPFANHGIEDADMEDLGARRKPSPAPRHPTPEPAIPDFLTGPLPNPSKNYSAWIKAMRPRWRFKQEQRWAGDENGSGNLASIFKGVQSKTSRRWDVVQLRPSSHPGRFILWLSLDGELVSAPLRIPRIFYIRLRSAKEHLFQSSYYQWQKVSRALPRGLPANNLYQLTVKEDVYLDIQEHFFDLTNDPDVDGVFELQVPLILRAMLRLGKSCVSSDASMTLNRGQTLGFDLSQLEQAPLSTRSYLDNGRNLKFLFLYHGFTADGRLHVFALISPTGSVRLHIVDPATRRQPITRLSETYRDLRKKRIANNNLNSAVDYPSSPEFNTTYHTKEDLALKAISREIGLMEGKSFVVVISSARDQSYFERNIPKLSRFPLKASHNLDGIGWQQFAAAKILGRYFALGPWVERTIALSEYYDVPIGHIEGDQPLLLADISFARRLVQQDMVLWWSSGDQPDLGGIDQDQRPFDDLPSTEFSTSGCYSNVCLEITVRNLAINSVLHSVLVNELEGSGGTTTFDMASKTLNEYSQSATESSSRGPTLGESNMSTQTFGILKAMVKVWLLDRIEQHDSPAVIGVDHFWRWIGSRASSMYDPSIHRFIHGLMRKTFIQMLAEFRRLGSAVVYADLGRIVLATAKPPGTAHAYAQYIISAVNSHELFQHVYLDQSRVYDFLLFMDVANYGAILCQDDAAEMPLQRVEIEAEWNIEAFLPRAIQEDFARVVEYFIVELHRLRQKTNEVVRVPLQNLIENGAEEMKDEAKEKEENATKNFLARDLARKLLKLVDSIETRRREATKIGGEEAESFEFPILPGSHLHLTKPTLEFIKFVCAIFSLKKEVQVEVGLLKRTLLDLISEKEFSSEAIFINPCEPLKLSNVPCAHCDSIRDFDFCRDPDLMASSAERTKWTCHHCRGEYDRLTLEFMLIDVVKRIERKWSQVDLVCQKCGQSRDVNLSKFCRCSGQYALAVGGKAGGRSKPETKRQLKVIVNVAIVNNLGRLKEVAQTILSQW
ncbi:hypothetical protein DL96DRAFT_1602053 [Flagelloscypha sp. PMI_526]|nr:hypothetical protein DL96DRAFT_1602053 [Flagelloscypha sp. PMI_526]